MAGSWSAEFRRALGNSSKAVIKEAAPKLGIKGLIAKAARINAGAHVVQLFDADAVANRAHVLGAYLNALVAFKNRTNRSKSIAMEMLLFASLTDQIGTAIRISGAKPGSRIVVFASDKESFSRIAPLLKDVKEFVADIKREKRVLKVLGVKKVHDTDSDMLRAMAVSRLSA